MSKRRHGNKEAKKVKKVQAAAVPPVVLPVPPRPEPVRRGSK